MTVWPFPLNWGSKPSLRLEWLTEVISSRSGTEQRFKLRNGARVSTRFENQLRDDRARVIFENLLLSGQAEEFGLPWWPGNIATMSASEAGDTSLSVTDTSYSGISAGGDSIALVNDYRSEVILAQSVGNNVIELDSPLVGSWPRGSTVSPLKTARLRSSQPLRYLTDRVAVADVEFHLTEDMLISSTEVPAYLGSPILFEKTEASGPVQSDVVRSMAVFDNQTGLRAWRELGALSGRTRSHRFMCRNAQQLDNLILWLFNRSGRYNPFWQPTNQQDFKVLNAISAGSTTVLVENRGHVSSLGQPGRNHIMLQLRDGSYVAKRIASASSINANTELLTLETPIEAQIALNQIDTACYLQYVRLATDAVEVIYETQHVATCSTVFQLLRDDL